MAAGTRFQGGTLRGITSTRGYLADLGVTALWIGPSGASARISRPITATASRTSWRSIHASGRGRTCATWSTRRNERRMFVILEHVPG